MKYLNLPISTLMLRFYLMMAVVVIAGFSGLWFLSILALPIFFSALLGVTFKKQHSIKKTSITKSYGLSSDQHHPAH